MYRLGCGVDFFEGVGGFCDFFRSSGGGTNRTGLGSVFGVGDFSDGPVLSESFRLECGTSGGGVYSGGSNLRSVTKGGGT